MRPHFFRPLGCSLIYPFRTISRAGAWTHLFERMSAQRIVRQFRVPGTARDAHALWRDHERLAADLGELRHLSCTAEQLGSRTHWRCHPTHAGPLTWETQFTADVPGRLLTWSSLPREPFQQMWDFWIAERADGHGTDVRLVIELVSDITDSSTPDRRNADLDGEPTGAEDPIFAVDPEGLVDHLIQRWQGLLAASR